MVPIYPVLDGAKPKPDTTQRTLYIGSRPMFMTWKFTGMVSPTVTLSAKRGITNSILAGCRISTSAVPEDDRFRVLLLS